MERNQAHKNVQQWRRESLMRFKRLRERDKPLGKKGPLKGALGKLAVGHRIPQDW